MSRTTLFTSLTAGLVVIATATPAAANTTPGASASLAGATAPRVIYVDATLACSDTGTGTETMPYCTIKAGQSKLVPGATLVIGNGTYAETVRPPVSGTRTSPVTITTWEGRSPTVGVGMTYGVNLTSRSDIVVSGLRVQGTIADGITGSTGTRLTITGNTVTSAGRRAQYATAPGIKLKAVTDSLVEGNTTIDNSDTGIYLAAGTTGVLVRRNTSAYNAQGWQRNANGINVVGPANQIVANITHDNEDSGIQFFTGGDDGLALLNVTYNNGDHGIDDYNVRRGRLVSNTVFRNCTSGINVEGASAGDYVVTNNVAVDNAVYPAYQGISCTRRRGNIGIYDGAPPTTTVDHNLVYLSKPGTMYFFGSAYSTLAAMTAATGQELHGVQADPGFADASAWDLRLTAGSPAIDRGDSGVLGASSVDIVNAPRVDDPTTPNTAAEGPRLYDDLGAFEFQP